MIFAILAIVLILILLYLFLREFNCWYWKVNRKIQLLERQNELLEALVIKFCGGLPDDSVFEEDAYDDTDEDDILDPEHDSSHDESEDDDIFDPDYEGDVTDGDEDDKILL